MRIRNLYADVAKVIIIVLVFPLFAWMFDLRSLQQLVEGLPIFDTWLYILKNVKKVDPGDYLLLALNAFFEALLMGFFIGLFRQIGVFTQARGNLPILSTFFGLALSCIILRLLSYAGMAELLLKLALSILGLVIMFRGTFRSRRLFPTINILSLLADCLLAVAGCCLVVAYTMFSDRMIGLETLFSVIFSFLFVLFVAYIAGRAADHSQS